MPATYQSVATGSSTGGNYTITKPSGTVDGDLLFLVSYQDPDGSPTNQTASGFTQVGSTLDNATGSLKLWRKAASGEGSSYTIGCDASAAGIGIMIRIDGHDAASPIDGTPQTSTGAASTSHVAPSVTDVGGTNSLLITGAYGLCNGTAASYTALSAGTERADLQPTTGNWIVGSLGTEALSASGATGTRTWTCSISRAFNTFSVAIASAATSIPSSPQRNVPARDTSEVPWLQRDRRDANTVATAANPLVPPLDSAWQASARHWHLYSDYTRPGPFIRQRAYLSDPALLDAAPDIPAGSLRSVQTRDTGEAQWIQRRPTDPALLNSALLENELLGSADTLRHNQAAVYYDRRLVPTQPQRESSPDFLNSALLENELLGGAETAKRINLPATHADRREYPPPRPAAATIDDTPTDPLLVGWVPSWLADNLAATHVDRREVPQQRLYISDPSFYPTIPPTDPLTLAWGAGGPLWHLYNTAAAQVTRRLVPQQRERESDPNLLSTALLEDALLGGADLIRHILVAAYWDRREVPQQRVYVLPPSTALLEDVLLGGGDTTRHYAVFTDRRQTVGWQPRWPDPNLNATVTDPITFAAGVGGDMWRRTNTPAYADRREVPQQPPRVTLYFDAGPGIPPLTLSWGVGGNLWHIYNRAADIIDRVWQPQQRPRRADLELLAIIPAVNATSESAVTTRRSSTSPVTARRSSTGAVTARRTSTSDASEG